jgi:hypothetical protein
MRTNQSGMSFVEVLVSLLLVTGATFTLLRYTSSAYQGTGHNADRQFAIQKAISMLEELKSLVQIQGDSATVLDGFDDGTTFKTVLTTDRSIADPQVPPSDNVHLGSGWKYTRQVTVSLLPGTNDPAVRLVNVKVALNRDEDHDGKPDLLGEVAGVIRTAAGNYAPTQVYDVYALAVENVPGWWVYMANLIPFMQSAFQNLQARNPGLEFRVHWITKLSYGRDMEYRPAINRTADSLQAIDKVYFYPGRMPAGEAVDFYYPPDNFRGHVSIDGSETNGYNAATEPNPYALADQYNHAMRYPDELAMFQSRVASGQETDDAPTLRILLERLYQRPDQFANAVFINLHGELFPFPPIRNYSDPAKDPTGYPGIRAVTHPERLHYAESATSVKLRVYSYRTDPDNLTAVTNRDWIGQGTASAVPIQITLKGVSWTPASGSGEIVAIRGGTDQDGTAGADAYQAVAATTTPSATGMYYQVTTAGADTILSLYNSPLKSPEVLIPATTDYTGINVNSRLYGLEYIPAPAEDLTAAVAPPTAFTADLAAIHHNTAGLCTDGACETNTARWVITIPDTVLPGGAGGNGLLTVETRLDSTTSGTRTNLPPDLSRTYVWRGTDLWTFGDGTAANPPHLPITESYQVLGDPRHNPYADLKSPHFGSGLPRADRLGLGYNRYFDDFHNATVNAAAAPAWSGYSYTVGGQNYGVKNDASASNDGWRAAGTGYVEIDMNRAYQILRTIVARPRTVFTTMTGYSYYYCGIGGEIGYDSANGFAASIPLDAKPFTGVSAATHEDSILPSVTSGVKYVSENVAGGWWGLHWLGELYPDSAYTGVSGWAATGNLPTGVGPGRFVRTLRSNILTNLPRGTTLIGTGRRTGPEGSTDYYWTGTANATFHHVPSNGTGNLLAGGTEIANRYNFPLSDGIPINRPFSATWNDTTKNPDDFLQTPYGPVFQSSFDSLYYDHSVQAAAKGSALLSLADNQNHVAFVTVNGISMTGESGTNFIANWSLMTLIQSFLTAGRYNAANGFANHVEQLPRVVITSPNASTNLLDPGSITVGWNREWLRWDGQSYTTAYPGNYAETSALSYAVMYSADNGSTWHYMQDGTTATPGVRPNAAHLISTASATPTYAWGVPSASFPQGTYLIRVEAYRDNLPLHYAYHQYSAFIRRG